MVPSIRGLRQAEGSHWGAGPVGPYKNGGDDKLDKQTVSAAGDARLGEGGYNDPI